MTRRSGRVRRAVKAGSSELLACLPEQPTLPYFKISHHSELDGNDQARIWNVFEENMFNLYSSSSFGWTPEERKKEMFHDLSRFLLVYDSKEEEAMLAFCMFRFETEDGENIIYCYDLQVSSRYHRTGVGRKLITILSNIGKAFEMEKIVLTVLKANTKAIEFYKACNFEVDPTSPSRFLDKDDPERESYDYEIMSKILKEP